MSSPVLADDFTVASQGQSFCERMTNLLNLSKQMKLWFDWAFDETGYAKQALRAMFLPPPGVIVPFYTQAGYEGAALEVRRLDRDDADISAYGTSDATKAFWLLCDGTNGTPDLRGRVLLSAGHGAGLTNRVVSDVGGVERVTLAVDQIPAHTHDIIIHKGSEENNGPQIFATDETEVYKTDYKTSSVGGGASHDNMPPYYVLYYIMRTTRRE